MARTYDWQYSIDRCNQIKERDFLFGHMIPFKQGDFVKSHDGLEGKVTHVEYLREDPNTPGGVWYINVQDYNSIRTYTNPAELRKINALTRR